MANNTRKYSRPSIEKMFEAGSEASIRAIDTYVNRTLAALYTLDVVLFFIGSETVSEEANEKVKALLDGKLERFRKLNAELAEKVEEFGLTDPVYTNAIVKTFKIYTPLASKYLNLLRLFEMNIRLTDALWLGQEMESTERNKTAIKTSHHMENVSREIINLSRRALALAEAEGKDSEAKETLKEMNVEIPEEEQVRAKGKTKEVETEKEAQVA